jgi:hypothetical protein
VRRQEATFRSSSFNTLAIRDYFINDCCFGDDLARWMMARLRQAGIATDPEPGQEDFGWYFEFTVHGGKHCCVLGFQEGDPEGLWRMWVERGRGFFGSVLGMSGYGIQPAAVRALNDCLLRRFVSCNGGSSTRADDMKARCLRYLPP